MRDLNNNASHHERRRASQDIMESRYRQNLLDGPVNPQRRREATDSFRAFCESYGGDAFSLGWSPAHLECIEKIERSTLNSGSFALALPRGSGKSTLCHWALVWSLLCGHCEYSIYVAATASGSTTRLASLKTTLRFNDLLLEDFPEVIAPIRFTENEARKAAGQRFCEEKTDIRWGSDKLIFATLHNYQNLCPWIDEYPSNFGAIMDFASLESGLRGKSVERPDGRIVRPQLAVVDDPSTRESAASPAQNKKRYDILMGDIGYLGSPERPCGILVPCTIIYEDDLAHQLMCHEKAPQFKGVCYGMLDRMPWEDMSEEQSERVSVLWEQDYAELRRHDLLEGTNHANEFYLSNRDEMDGNSVAGWEERKNIDEHSAIQHAMNLYLKDQHAFFCEAMNKPIPLQQSDKVPLKPDDIYARGINISKGTAIAESDFCTAFIDVSRNVLWWSVVCFNRSSFRAHVLDYGVFPEQNKPYVTLAGAKKTIPDRYKGDEYSVALTKALDELCCWLLAKNIVNEAGDPVSIERIGIDSGWGTEATTVYNFCRRSSHKHLLVATKGFGSSPLKRPLVDPEKKREPRSSLDGQWKFTKNRAGTNLLIYDTNKWKTQVDNALRLPASATSALTIYNGKLNGRTPNHIMFAEQMTAEKSAILEGGGRKIEAWTVPPHRDNHLFDCVVGSFMLANVLGAKIQSTKNIAGLNSAPKRVRRGWRVV